jgi:hypothetical protein
MNCLQQRFAIQWYLARPCIISGQDGIISGQDGIISGQDGIISGQDGIISGQDGIISGQDARTTRNFGIFFKLEVS